MLVPLPEYHISPAVVNCHNPKRNNRSPYPKPPKLINASSLGKGHDKTSLDVNLPADATLEELLYTEKNISGDDGSHDLGNINDDADDDISQSCAVEAGG